MFDDFMLIKLADVAELNGVLTSEREMDQDADGSDLTT